MARNYGNYSDDESSGNNSGSSSSGDGEDDKNLTITPFAEIEGTLGKVFGNDNRFGQSLGLSWEDVEVVDGCLYYDSEKDKHKLFSWKDVIGMMPGEGDFTSDDANQFLVKNYGGTEKRYELVEAVHPDDDEPVNIGNVVMWYSGSDEYGPKSASKTLAQILTTHGREMVVRDDDGDVSADIKNWLTATSPADDLARADLSGRRFSFFEVKKESNNSDRHYHHPIVEDVETGTQVTVDNSADSASQGTLDGEAAATTDGGAPAAQTTEGVPEPVSDFVSSVAQFDDFTEDRAATLLNDFITDDGLPLTQDLVDDFGGESAVLAEAGY